MRSEDYRKPCAPGVPPSGNRGGSESTHSFYEDRRGNNGNFDQGIEQVVMAVLASPEFLYRSIRGVPVLRAAILLRIPRLLSRISSWLPVFPFSCGIQGLTTNS